MVLRAGPAIDPQPGIARLSGDRGTKIGYILAGSKPATPSGDLSPQMKKKSTILIVITIARYVITRAILPGQVTG